MGGLIFLGVVVIALCISFVTSKIGEIKDSARATAEAKQQDLINAEIKKHKSSLDADYAKKIKQLKQDALKTINEERKKARDAIATCEMRAKECEDARQQYQQSAEAARIAEEKYKDAYNEIYASETQKQIESDAYIKEREKLHEQANAFIQKAQEAIGAAAQERDEAISQMQQEAARYQVAYNNIYREALASFNKLFDTPLLPYFQQRRFLDAFQTERGYRALTENLTPIELKDAVCTVRSSSGNSYTTTLTSCTCDDFVHRKQCCKHMMALAIRLYAFPYEKAGLIDKMQKDAYKAHEALQISKSEINAAETELRAIQKKLPLWQKEREQQENWLQKMQLDFPWIAGMLADVEQRFDTVRLKTLPKGAYKSAELVKEMKHEKKELLLRAARAEALLATYEHLFPWLEEFRSVPLDEALSAIADTDNNEDYDAQTKKWLSPQEYAKLPAVEKYQLALDRYQNRKKTDWEIGIEYERYIGYLYEQEGYTVKYFGATEGLQDMGRDLIATKGSHALIIQCKRWAESKTIHEKHIFQLYGTTFILQLKDPTHTYTPVFVTTTTLSDIAKECAERLHVEVHARRAYSDHPLIKCNIGKDEYGAPVRIYHLPFDQQYDRIVIEPGKGECYAKTVAEAEALGFRRAKRHVPD